jgi:hypothetical protein
VVAATPRGTFGLKCAFLELAVDYVSQALLRGAIPPSEAVSAMGAITSSAERLQRRCRAETSHNRILRIIEKASAATR